MKALNMVSSILLIVGGLNWGLVGLLNMDLVATLLGEMTMAAKIVYVLVGLSAVLGLVNFAKMNKA